MRFDPIITNAGRLTILTALCDEAKQDFVTLRRTTQLTDGNLTTHARKLAGAGLVTIEKASRAGKPVTFITLTDEGKAALTRHVAKLTSSVTVQRAVPVPIAYANNEQEQGAWID
ncbi:MAG: transcriptional regulator [Burkholderiales bacterium]|nr:transcriptional regulator [Phycisphaerae bacterium]